ncbi:retrovirus-related Pol polyprotein from transposon 297 [Trichonephila clavipes]|nr:retrovirus-related Pol polyprotein from transposon 297 [Trichonephila clavipes]
MGIASGNYGHLLIPIMLKQLPHDLVVEFYRQKDSKNFGDVRELMKLIKFEIESRESANIALGHSQKIPENSRYPPRNLSYQRQLPKFKHNIPSSSALTTGHLLGRALDWYQIFGSTLVQNTATDFAQLKAALSKAFSAIQNRKDLETCFYTSQQRQNQEPTDFVYDLLKLNKKLELGMSEKALVDHIFVRLEPQVQDYVEGCGNYQNNRQGNQWFESRNRLQNDDRRFSDRGYQFRNRGQNDDFSRGNQRNSGSSENFSRGSRKQMGRLNVLKVSDIKDKPGLTHVLYHEIDTGDNPPVVSRTYRYDRLKQEILDYHVDKMLKEGTIIPIQSPYASPVVLCRKNNGLPPDNPEAYRFAVDYRKLNAITKYPRYPLPLIDDLIMNIPHTGIMFALDLRSGYFQMAVNPSDIVKTAFVTKNGTYAFRRMPFGLSGAAPNFQKAIDIILKPVIGKFVSVYGRCHNIISIIHSTC